MGPFSAAGIFTCSFSNINGQLYKYDDITVVLIRTQVPAIKSLSSCHFLSCLSCHLLSCLSCSCISEVSSLYLLQVTSKEMETRGKTMTTVN